MGMTNEEYEAKRKAILGNLTDNRKVIEIVPTCSCGVSMVRRFGKGYYYCPFCEITEKDLVTKKVAKKANNRHVAQEARKAKNDLHPLRGFFRRFSERMLDEHGYKHNVIFRNIQGGNHRTLSDGTHEIKMGYRAVDYFSENGFKEYKTWRHLWYGKGSLVGKKAMWAVAIHEVAHAVQSENNGRYYRSAHNQVWATAVEELQILYPWEEVKNL